MMLSFTVSGEPATKGSFRAFTSRGKVVVKHDNPRLPAWTEAIGWAARQAMQGRPPIGHAVAVEAHFRCRWEGEGEPSGVPFVDGDKMLRALWDGMTGIVFKDDALVTAWSGTKSWAGAEGPGVTVIVRAPEQG